MNPAILLLEEGKNFGVVMLCRTNKNNEKICVAMVIDA